MKPTNSPVAIQVGMHRKTLDLRAINRLIQNPEFASVWNYASHDKRNELLKFIDKVNIEAIRVWFEKTKWLTLRNLSKRGLIDLARYYQVKNYSRMTKFALCKELRKKGIDDETIQERY